LALPLAAFSYAKAKKVNTISTAVYPYLRVSDQNLSRYVSV